MNKRNKRKLFATLFFAQRGHCAYCCCQMTEPSALTNGVALPSMATFDHIKPRSLGGRDEEANLLLACVECNSAKGSAYENRLTGPTPEEVADDYAEPHLRIAVKSALYELERMLVSATKQGLPKRKKDTVWMAYRFWEHQLLAGGMQKSMISKVQRSGAFLREAAIASCWVPLPEVHMHYGSL